MANPVWPGKDSAQRHDEAHKDGFLGVLMLDTAFKLPPGDVGAEESYDIPVRILRVPRAEALDVVRAGAPLERIVDGFITAARQLEAEGAFGLITSCGFLVRAQAQIAAAVRIPVIASALTLGPLARAASGGARLGVMTADARALDEQAIIAAGLSPREVVIEGLENEPIWRRTILAPKARQSTEFDQEELAAVIVARARRLQKAAPDLGAVLLECANLPPYAAEIRDATGLPVWNILDAAALLYRGSFPTRFRR